MMRLDRKYLKSFVQCIKYSTMFNIEYLSLQLYTLVGPAVTGPVQDPTAATCLDN